MPSQILPVLEVVDAISNTTIVLVLKEEDAISNSTTSTSQILPVLEVDDTISPLLQGDTLEIQARSLESQIGKEWYIVYTIYRALHPIPYDSTRKSLVSKWHL